MKKMDTVMLEAFVGNVVKGTTFVSLVCETEPKMVKKHRETGEANPFLGAIKKSKKMGAIGFDYENSVNNQAGREGLEAREAKPRAWGILSDNRIFVHHKGESYLQLKLQGTENTSYWLNGKRISADLLKPYLPIPSVSSTQSDIEKTVIVNDIKLSNIRVMRIKDMSIRVTPPSISRIIAQEKEMIKQAVELADKV